MVDHLPNLLANVCNPDIIKQNVIPQQKCSWIGHMPFFKVNKDLVLNN